MGEMSQGSHLLFTGHDKYFPVEMFIASVEEFDIKEEEGEVVESLCQRALQVWSLSQSSSFSFFEKKSS